MKYIACAVVVTAGLGAALNAPVTPSLHDDDATRRTYIVAQSEVNSTEAHYPSLSDQGVYGDETEREDVGCANNHTRAHAPTRAWDALRGLTQIVYRHPVQATLLCLWGLASYTTTVAQWVDHHWLVCADGQPISLLGQIVWSSRGGENAFDPWRTAQEVCDFYGRSTGPL
jgi:hypothetical protein